LEGMTDYEAEINIHHLMTLIRWPGM
jgi:hypothetical protein